MSVKILHKYIYEDASKEKLYTDRTLEEIVKDLGYIEDFTYVAYIDQEDKTSKLIDKKYWKAITPKSGEYFITQTPAGDSLKMIVSAIIVAVAIYTGQTWAADLGLKGMAAAGFAATAGVVGGMLAQAIVPMTVPNSPGQVDGPSESATLSISGSRNQVKPGSPVPYIIGSHRTVPPLAAQPIRDVNGKSVTLRQVFCVGYAPLSISDIRIGDTPIEDFDDVEVKISDGYKNVDMIDTISGDMSSQGGLSIVLAPSVNNDITGSINAEKAEIVLAFRRGLVELKDDGSYANRSVGVEVFYRKVGAGTWIPENPTTKVTVTCVKNSTTIKTLAPNGQFYQTKTYWNSYINFVSGIPASISVGDYIRVGGSVRNNGKYKIFSISGNLAYISTVDFRNGYWQRDEGDTLEDESNVDVNINLGGGAGTARTFTDATTQTTYRTITIDHLDRAQWEFRIKRNTATSSSNKIIDEVTLVDVKTTSLTEDAGELITAFPAGFAYIGIKIKANDQLNGTISNLSCLATSVPYRYDAGEDSFVEDITESGNPAWEFTTALMRDSAKSPVSGANIDTAEMISWAARCNTLVNGKKRHVVNHVVDYSTKMDDLLVKIASVGRASRTQVDGNYTVIQDVGGRAATQKFTPSNSYNFSANKSFVKRPDAFSCEFVNPNKDWSLDTIDVWLDDAVTSGTLKADLDCTGITDVDELYRYGKFAHAQVALRPEEYSLSTGIENLRSTRGDIVIVAHDKIQGDVLFGRVTGFDATTVTLDNGATLTAGAKVCGFRHNTQTQPTSTFVVEGQAGRVFTITGGTAAIADLAIGDMCMIGNSVASVSSKYIIKSIEASSDMTAELILSDYADPDLYNSEGGVIANYVPHVSKPGLNVYKKPVTPVLVETYSDEKALKVMAGGSLQERIAIDIDIPTDDTLPVPAFVKIGYKPTGSDAGYYTEPLKEVIGTTYFCNEVRELSTYDIKIQLVSEIGIQSDALLIPNITVSGKTNPPSDIVDLVQTKSGSVYTLSWTAAPEVDVAGYVMYKDGVEYERVIGTSVTLNNLNNGSNTYSVKAVDTSGNLSVNFDEVIFVTTLSAPNITTTDSGTSRLIKNADGTINSRVYVAWTTSDAVSGYNVRYKLTTDTAYTNRAVNITNTYLENMQEGGTYEIEVQGIGVHTSILSNWTQVQHQVVGKSQVPSDVATGAAVVEDRSIILSWGAIVDLDVKEYEIRKGTTWATATFITTVNSTSWTRPADVTGDHTWLIKAIDTSGLYSATAKVIELTILAAEVPVISAQIIDNNVLLSYLSTAGTLPIFRYEIKKITAANPGGTVIGSTASNFTPVFETAGGTYTYEIVCIDIAGNRSVKGVYEALVGQPPDYVLNSFYVSTFGGTLVNSSETNGQLTMPSCPTGQTWAAYLAATPTYTTITPEVVAGFTGWLTPTDGALSTYTEVYDYGTILTSSLVTPQLTEDVKSGTPTIVMTMRGSVDNIVWVDYGVVTGATLITNFRYVEFKVSVTPTDTSEYVRFNTFSLKLDVKIGNDSINGTSNAADTGGTSFNFTTSFVDVTSITVTPKLGSGAVYGLYDFVDTPYPTDFKVLLYDINGNRVTGEFSAVIGGFI